MSYEELILILPDTEEPSDSLLDIKSRQKFDMILEKSKGEDLEWLELEYRGENDRNRRQALRERVDTLVRQGEAAKASQSPSVFNLASASGVTFR